MTLIKWRKIKKMTQANLAKKLGLANYNVIARYENGSRVPRPDIIKRIARLTQGRVTANDFYRE